jgi:hypothetical protein
VNAANVKVMRRLGSKLNGRLQDGIDGAVDVE